MANIVEFTRKIDALLAAYKKLPVEIAAVAVNFSKERFREQAWLDGTKEAWQPTKRGRNDGRKKTILVRSGRLKNSIRKISADENEIVIGTSVPYAQIHNEGGKINKTVSIRQHTRTRNGRRETVKAHSRKLNTTIPRRQFLGSSQTLEKRIINLTTARFMRALRA